MQMYPLGPFVLLLPNVLNLCSIQIYVTHLTDGGG